MSGICVAGIVCSSARINPWAFKKPSFGSTGLFSFLASGCCRVSGVCAGRGCCLQGPAALEFHHKWNLAFPYSLALIQLSFVVFLASGCCCVSWVCAVLAQLPRRARASA